jgi:hypothetical protein
MNPKGSGGDVVSADLEWPDARQSEIAPQGASCSEPASVGMFGFEAA